MKYDLLFHVNANDPEVFKIAFGQAANYKREANRKRQLSALDIATKAAMGALEVEQGFRLVMVVNGPAVRQLLKDNTELQEFAEKAVNNGLKIHAGQYALEAGKITKDDLWSFVEIVPSATLEIVQLQNEGFAYIKV